MSLWRNATNYLCTNSLSILQLRHKNCISSGNSLKTKLLNNVNLVGLHIDRYSRIVQLLTELHCNERHYFGGVFQISNQSTRDGQKIKTRLGYWHNHARLYYILAKENTTNQNILGHAAKCFSVEQIFPLPVVVTLVSAATKFAVVRVISFIAIRIINYVHTPKLLL